MGWHLTTTASTPTNTQTLAFVAVAITSALAISLASRPRLSIMIVEDETKEKETPLLPSHFHVERFQNSRSQSLFTFHLPAKKDTTTTSSSPVKAMLVFVHGLADHCSRTGYIAMYEELSAAGVDVYGFDSHGHGQSEGEPRGYVEKFDHYVDDLVDYVKHCQKKYVTSGGNGNNNETTACPPLILMGHSMGALVSVLATLRIGNENIGGLLLTGPALGVDMNPILHIQKMLAPAIDKFLPKSKIVDAVRPSDMSRNPKAVQAYIDDPWIPKGKLIARTAIQVDKHFRIARERRGEITCPLLMLHGTDDRCTSIQSSRDFFKHVGSSKKRFLQLPGLFHEIFEEPEVDQFMPSIIQFVASGGKQFAQIDDGKEDEYGLINVVFSK